MVRIGIRNMKRICVPSTSSEASTPSRITATIAGMARRMFEKRAAMAQAKMKKVAAPMFQRAQATPIRQPASMQAPTCQPRAQKLAKYSGMKTARVAASSAASTAPGST